MGDVLGVFCDYIGEKYHITTNLDCIHHDDSHAEFTVEMYNYLGETVPEVTSSSPTSCDGCPVSVTKPCQINVI